MKYAAKIENAIVTAVVTLADGVGVEWAIAEFGGEWIETSTTGAIRKNYAGIGYAYDVQLDAFIPPRPFQSWVLDPQSCQWQAPIPMPPGGPWVWDEDSEEWIEWSL